MIFFIFIIGLCVGSFLNVCIYRMPKSISIVKPRSFCPRCENTIPWYDNIPLLSYIILKGRCRNCKTKISFKYFLIEAITAFLFITLYIHFNSWQLFIPYAFLASGFIIATFTDLSHRIIPDEVNFGLLGLGVILSFIFPVLHNVDSRWMSLLYSLLGALVGGGSIFLLGVLGKLIFKKESMGGGDVKLLAMAGSFLGWKLILLSFFIAPFFGAIFGIIRKIIYKDEYIPYGPFLALGCLISVLWANEILSWIFFRSY